MGQSPDFELRVDHECFRVAIYGATPQLVAGTGLEDIISLSIEGNKVASDAQHSKTANQVTLRKGETRRTK